MGEACAPLPRHCLKAFQLCYYTRLAEGVTVPAWLGEAVRQTLTLACALGYGASFVPAPVRAQEKINGAVIVPSMSTTRDDPL
jgi:hypothetical protein